MKLDKGKYDSHVADGMIRASHRDGLTLYNYSAECQYGRHWNDETMTARGLVLTDDGTVIARPFRKFFNLGEHEESSAPNLPDQLPDLFVKYDGSLIICFFDGERWRAVTRGSWESEQAVWASRWIGDHATDDWPKHRTLLWELTAPWNRIVVPYGEERMVLLAVMDHDGVERIDYRDWGRAAGVDVAEHLGQQRIEEIDLGGRQQGEGFVARYANGLRVKLKYDHYVALHRLITSMSPRRIWEMVVAGSALHLDDDLPDEFRAWATGLRDRMVAQFGERVSAVEAAFASGRTDGSRKEYAESVGHHAPWLRACLFARLDNKPVDEIIWKSIRPSPTTAIVETETA